MTIDCSIETADRLEALLAEAEAARIVNYGLHRQDAALMTCIVPSPFQDDHMHFLDGAGGGYALSALNLKTRLAQRHAAGAGLLMRTELRRIGFRPIDRARTEEARLLHPVPLRRPGRDAGQAARLRGAGSASGARRAGIPRGPGQPWTSTPLISTPSAASGRRSRAGGRTGSRASTGQRPTSWCVAGGRAASSRSAPDIRHASSAGRCATARIEAKLTAIDPAPRADLARPADHDDPQPPSRMPEPRRSPISQRATSCSSTPVTS